MIEEITIRPDKKGFEVKIIKLSEWIKNNCKEGDNEERR